MRPIWQTVHGTMSPVVMTEASFSRLGYWIVDGGRRPAFRLEVVLARALLRSGPRTFEERTGRFSKCQRNIEMTSGAQSRDDAPVGGIHDDGPEGVVLITDNRPRRCDYGLSFRKGPLSLSKFDVFKT
jgi:hypothetical protein